MLLLQALTYSTFLMEGSTEFVFIKIMIFHKNNYLLDCCNVESIGAIRIS
jgi:hypothetical protein